MKGILLSFIAFGFLILVSVFAVRFYRGKKYFKPLIGVFILSAIFYTLLFYLLPENPGLNPYLNFCNGFLILFLLFHSYWDAIYTSFFTGFSSKILIQFLRKGDAGLSLEEIFKMYREPQGSNPVIDLRLQNLVQGNYLTRSGDGQYQLLPKGNFFASLARTCQRVFQMGEGG